MKEKQKKAAALKYRHGSKTAPTVVAKGKGTLADRIIALAKEHGVPIREDRNLVEAISTLELNDEIPSELYKAVAEVLIFIYRLSGQTQNLTQ
ncbi:MAG TPA: EscU/YscU/HrcU family type III secretion system export apparatus switch protein [Nitrospirota bacterium]|nr:EscU/YscU/HrcU family type III secretion system export apparatus switch protein [Nitrospirota bacterium]